MKLFTPTLALASFFVLPLTQVFAQADADSLSKEKAKLPDAVRKIAEKGDTGAASAAVKTATTKAKSLTTTPAVDKNDPANWGQQEVHKIAVMDISYGGVTDTVMIELLDNAAPKTVANFTENCAAGSYKGLAFHRAIDNYLVQTGDPLTADDSKRNEWGTGGAEKTVPGEFKLPHKIGSVAMARRGDAVNPKRESNGYQFYIALGNLSSLDGSYTVFGQVVSGLELLREISQAPADSNDCPLSRIEVKGIRVVDQKGPLIVMKNSSGNRKRFTKPASARGTFERILDRVW